MIVVYGYVYLLVLQLKGDVIYVVFGVWKLKYNVYCIYIGEIIICLRLEVVDCVIECFMMFLVMFVQEEYFVIKSKRLKFVFIEILVMIECFYVLIIIQLLVCLCI